MNLFFSKDVHDGLAHFTDEEARHVLQVLRKKTGDRISFVDGMGGWYDGVIEETRKDSFSCRILSGKAESKRGFHLHIAITPTKSMDRFEWFLEKATEIGIDEITPIISSNSERSILKSARLEKILLAAMKQSLKATLPKLNELMKFSDFIANIPESSMCGLRFIAHCREDGLPHLKNNYFSGNDVCLLIGPEGDFTEKEVHLALQKGWKAVSLGHSRLRTETAGLAACFTVNLLNEV